VEKEAAGRRLEERIAGVREVGGVPRGRAAGPLTVAVDTREKYGWKFAGRPVTLERRALIARR